MSLIDGGPRSATATAIVDTECYMVTKENFTKYLMELNPFAYRVFRTLVGTIRKMNKGEHEQ